MRTFLRYAAPFLVLPFLGACAYLPQTPVMSTSPVYLKPTPTQDMLGDLPPPDHPVAVAVYGFADETGQFKPSAVGQTLSRAISQGASAMLLRSLQEAGNRQWFTIVEREQLRDLLNERQIIRDMRSQYLGEKTVNPSALPPLLFAGVLLEGGVVGYDTNTVTGGVGASMLGIGADAKYQQDTVTVYLRAVSVKTGEVLTTVTASKTITSYAVDTNVFKYVGATTLLESENGYTTNEPAMLALQQAIDKAVYGLVMEGADLKLWDFADSKAAWPALWRYKQERDGIISAEAVAAAEARGHGRKPGTVKPTDVPPPPAPTAAPAPVAMAAPVQKPAPAIAPLAMNVAPTAADAKTSSSDGSVTGLLAQGTSPGDVENRLGNMSNLINHLPSVQAAGDASRPAPPSANP